MRKIIFDEKSHRYTLDGKEIPSVTQVLQVIAKPALVYWGVNKAIGKVSDALRPDTPYTEGKLREMLSEARREPNKVKDEASSRGKVVHEWVERYINGDRPEMPDNQEIRGYVECFKNWVEEENVKLEESEVMVFNDKEGYCGTLDVIAKVKRKRYLIDVKTSKNIYPEHLLQTAAYQAAYKKKIHGRIILKLQPTKEAEYLVTQDFENDYRAFLGALELYKFIKNFENQ